MERIEELWPGGFRLIQDDAHFKLGMDSVLLASFPALPAGTRVCDLGCGTGAVCVLLAARQSSLNIDGIEVQPAAAALARRNLEQNGLSTRGHIVEGDLRNLKGLLSPGAYDLIVSNPPYFPSGSGKSHRGGNIAPAREECLCTIEDVCKAAAYLSRYGGHFSIVYRPERLIDLVCAMRSAGIEPKRMRFVIHRAGSAPSLVLVDGIRGGNPGLTVEPDLIVRNADDTETDEIKAIYRREG